MKKISLKKWDRGVTLSDWTKGVNTRLTEPPRTVVKNIVQNIDGTMSPLPGLLRSNKEGWWLTDDQIYWQPKRGSGVKTPPITEANQ